MSTIYLVILSFGYLWFIRRNESIEDRNFRGGSFFEMFPHKKNGMWRWKKYWWIEVPCMIFGIIIFFFIIEIT